VKAVVTGASGFLGSHLVRLLRERSHDVVAGTRKPAPELERLGARVVALDLGDREALRTAFKGRDVVFHVAAKTGVWGERADYWRSNVVGTENVIATCAARNVPRLVFTSSPSVVFDGRDQVRASNDLPYAKSFLCAYPHTKAVAEQRVLLANAQWGLATCALRPHLIFGAGDPHLIPRIAERARSRKLARIGDGKNEVTICAVENAAHAHVLAAESLSLGAAIAGRAYFIGQEQPVELWSWIADLLRRAELPAIERSVSKPIAYSLGAMCELVWRVLGRKTEPPLTRFVAAQLSTSHSYDMAPALRDLGYREIVSTEQAVQGVVEALRGR
jgi:nucleoside-diphosphate-sugar epimerase